MEEERLLGVVGSLYDSVLDDSKWLEALSRLADYCGGTGAFNLVANPISGRILHSESVGVDPEVNERYLEYYAAKEVRIPPALRYAVGETFTEQTLLSRRAFQRSEIYGELLSPFDIPHVMALWVKKRTDAIAAVVIEGSHRNGPFSSHAVARFNLLAPHVVRASQLRGMLVGVRVAKRAYTEILDGMPFGVVLLAEDGSVLEMSRPADKLLRSRRGVYVCQSKLRAESSADDRQLQQAVRGATKLSVEDVIPGTTLSIRTADRRRTVTLTITPISAEAFFGPGRIRAIVLIVDPAAAPRPRTQLIQHTFDLTGAEAALATLLFDGLSLREAATALDRSVNTCKTQLKAIYEKTDCHNHAELAKKLLMSAFVTERAV